MTKVKVKKLKKGVKVGDQLPMKQHYGNVGRHLEREIAKNYKHNSGKGVDLPNEKVEIKTRKVEGVSYQTVGTMTIEDIISIPYEQSVVHDKIQQQYRVKYSDNTSTIIEEDIYDFSDPYIQGKIKEAYENGREKIINGERKDWIYGTKYGSFERSGDNSYSYRVSKGGMADLEKMAKDTFNKFFEVAK